MARMSAAVTEAALFPELDVSDPPPGHPWQVRKGDGYQVGFRSGTSYAMVFVRRLAEETLARCVGEVRALLAAEGFARAAWVVSEAAEPTGLAARLQEHGVVPWEENAEGMERRFRHLALIDPPAPAVKGVAARRVETFEEFVAASRVSHEAFDLSEQDRQLFEERQVEYWEWHQSDPDFERFAAYVDGELVGTASAIFGANAVYMIGGSVRADRRARGTYRALVRARWDAAVERGTPALTASAGAMSGPVLDRLGFATIGWGDVLSDRFS